MAATTEEIEKTYMDAKEAFDNIREGVWPPESTEGVKCCICGEPIFTEDLSGKIIQDSHTINLFITASAGDASLPYALEAHGHCLPELEKMLREKNKDWRWI